MAAGAEYGTTLGLDIGASYLEECVQGDARVTCVGPHDAWSHVVPCLLCAHRRQHIQVHGVVLSYLAGQC